MLKGSVYYTVGLGVEALVPFLMLPILTHILVPEEYGIWVIYVALFSFFRPLLGLTLCDALRMRFFRLESEERLVVLTAAIQITVFLTAGLLVLSVPFLDELSDLFSFPARWFWSTIVTACLSGIYYILLALLQFRNERKKYLAAQLTQTGATLVITLLLLAVGFEWQGVVLGKIGGLLFVILAILRLFLPEYPWRQFFSRRLSHYCELISFGVRYLPTGLELVVIKLMDRAFVARMVGLDEASFFGVGGQFALVLWLFVLGFLMAWQPRMFYELQVNGRSTPAVQRASWLFYFGLPLAGLVVVGCGIPMLHVLADESYIAAETYIWWLVAATVFQGYFQHNQTHLHGRQRVAMMGLCSLCVIGLNAVMNYYLIGLYGGVGAAWATAIAYASGAILNSVLLYMSSRRLRVVFD